ncbi:phospholipid/cholesterol/gamma-HCH transport system substrate-binding protein [Mycobacterium frederiksbergense]|uniref:Phospholipid/cholesterol/gamma-HCH transport system substrate-binding protein n=1 Tax=Mycolicibacterium frederiksbergense TaxID=117567 RepID=A0ABT6L526_9MYCO|nr:MCE family protein [Mycolicibacterium frederiksbergense]MDH6198058.1 phospholipid/cholesterol/gamma-HCH transport system substrate-binding protein [Mycolicibacterium frederiksbergense]
MIAHRRKRLSRTALVLLAVLAVAGAAVLVRQTVFKPTTIAAYFTSATAIYPGDEVRVAGVKVGSIKGIEPVGGQARITLAVDHGVKIPADAKAIIMAQNLVAARYVQLTPAYEDVGPTMVDGAQIGVERTAVPVEWDQVKDQLMRLASDLGPINGASATSLSRFVDSAAAAMDGNGEKLHEAISQLSGVAKILGQGSGDVVGIIKNLQVFVTALRDSNAQIVEFQGHLANVTSVVDGSRSDLDSALTNLADAVGNVRRFVAGSRDQTAEQLERLTNVTQNLVDNKTKLENVLHVAPNAIANGYNIYNPDSGTAVGAFSLANFSDPLSVVCSAIGAVKNATAAESSKLCAQYLGPALSLLNFNHMPMPFNAYLKKAPSPENLAYTDPNLAPGGAGGRPQPYADLPPAVSAYTGADDMAPPAGWGAAPGPPGAYAPNGLPANTSPAAYPGSPIVSDLPVQAPKTLQDMLLPAEAAPVPAPPAPGGTP